MQFVSDYMRAIDFVALAALVVIAAASLSRGGTVWLLVAAIVVAIWGASRMFEWTQTRYTFNDDIAILRANMRRR
jgi:uncharacterized membrane protein YdbT with pleckstrin-like domain